MLIVGLTGGIGAGKSAVSRILSDLGAVIIDADAIAREVVEPGTPGLDAVVAAFGAEILGPDGRLDRPRLGRIVFADREALARLNAIVHPLVGARTLELREAAPPDAVVVHDVPLLAENSMRGLYDLVVVVDVTPDTQIARLTGPRAMPEDEARSRMAAQATREQRLAIADIVIDNNGPFDLLRPRVEEVWSELRKRAEAGAGD